MYRSAPPPHRHVPGGRPQGAGAQLRALIAVAIRQRRRLLVAQVRTAAQGPRMQLAIGRLQQWLDRNPCPSAATVQAFTLATELYLVLPSTNRKAIRELQLLLA